MAEANPIAQFDPRAVGGDRGGRTAPGRAHRAHSVRKLHESQSDGGSGFEAHQQVRGRLSGRRYYGGCEHVDVAERLAIERAKTLFGADYVNVQPHSGLPGQRRGVHGPGRTGRHRARHEPRRWRPPDPRRQAELFGKALPRGAVRHRRREREIDFEEVAALAREHRPKLIVAGFSAYSRFIEWARFRAIADEVGARLFVDMAHVAGLVAVGLYPNPVPIADVVTTTTHKTLRGPRGGMILPAPTRTSRSASTPWCFPVRRADR